MLLKKTPTLDQNTTKHTTKKEKQLNFFFVITYLEFKRSFDVH